MTECCHAVCSCCVEQSPGSQAFVDHLLVDHVDLLNRDLPSWVHAHIYATHLLDFLGEKRHHKVRTPSTASSMACKPLLSLQCSKSSPQQIVCGKRAGALQRDM